MSYDPTDAAWDEAYERMSQELYPEHREQAISEFTTDRLQSYYLRNPAITHPGFRMQNEALKLLANGHYSAALVFAASATEQFLKVALLRPVVYGLVHFDSLAEMIVNSALSQTGYLRYTKLLSGLFNTLTSTELAKITLPGKSKSLLNEASELQSRRNDVVHKAEEIFEVEAASAIDVSAGVYFFILTEMLSALGLEVLEGKVVRKSQD
ncbi:hypothetical protein RHDC1_02432 [Rhodocyclaceae bacterium]|nr:hypothetical protein RHDC1_02432 [Rhodocyclaceae bacterium]